MWEDIDCSVLIAGSRADNSVCASSQAISISVVDRSFTDYEVSPLVVNGMMWSLTVLRTDCCVGSMLDIPAPSPLSRDTPRAGCSG